MTETDVVQGDQKTSDAEAVMLPNAGRKAEITLLLLLLLNVMLGFPGGNSGNATYINQYDETCSIFSSTWLQVKTLLCIVTSNCNKLHFYKRGEVR